MTSTPSPNPLRKALEDAAETFEVLAEGGKPLRSWKLCAERCRSALAADDAAGGWRDISTAPKDGTRVLACDPQEADDVQPQFVKWLTDGLNAASDYDGPGWYMAWDHTKPPFELRLWMPAPPLPPAPPRRSEGEAR